ncbi:hypothetical protein ACF0H5_010789 [Mactra antiquata]
MGHRGFGNLTKIYRQVSFGLSPFEQRTFPYYFSKGIPNTIRRLKRQAVLITPGIALSYAAYKWGIKNHDLSCRKDPEDYMNDK